MIPSCKLHPARRSYRAVMARNQLASDDETPDTAALTAWRLNQLHVPVCRRKHSQSCLPYASSGRRTARRSKSLLDRAFGPDRHARPSYRLREGLQPLRELCFVAEAEGRTRRHDTPLARSGSATTAPVLLLGPIAVDPARERQRNRPTLLLRTASGSGRSRRDTTAVVAVGTPSFLVGAPAFLCRFGFTGADRFGIGLPNLADPRRLFALALASGRFRRGERHDSARLSEPRRLCPRREPCARSASSPVQAVPTEPLGMEDRAHLARRPAPARC